MELFGYSERGFINAFFYDVFHQSTPLEIIRAFLKLAHWPFMGTSPPVIDSAEVDIILIEQSFAQFGTADVVILVSTEQEKAGFFCEAKRGIEWRLKAEWDGFKNSFQRSLGGEVSNVFKQVYLKQRLAQALATGDDLRIGLEFDGDLRTGRGDAGATVAGRSARTRSSTRPWTSSSPTSSRRTT